jgi:hypothetical protein
MAYAIVHHFPEGTKEQYENTVKEVHPDGGAAPPGGQTLHIAGETADGGWIVVAVHEDQASWESFRDETLTPGLQSLDNSLPGPPEELAFEVHTHQTA